jgi:carbonic anhydrase
MNPSLSLDQQSLIHDNLELLSSHTTDPIPLINDSDWDYSSSGSDWLEFSSQVSMQSPISIDPSQIVRLNPVGGSFYPFRFTYPLCSNPGAFFEKSFQTAFEDGFVDFLTLAGEQKRYYTQRIEIHAPAEHIINGKQRALELHAFHKERNTGNLMIFAVLFKISANHNSFVQDLIDGEEFDLQTLVGDRPQLFVYLGSLTYPPCTETVLWVINEHTQKISYEQVKFFSNKWENNQAFAQGRGNNRSVQLLNNRVVFDFV